MTNATNAPQAAPEVTINQTAPDQAMLALGVDVASGTLALALLWPTGKLKTKNVKNDERGFEELLTWAERHAKGVPLHVCMEATGGYEEEPALFLHERGMRLSVANPRRIKAYGQSKLRRSKTAKADAILIAQFCQKEIPASWQAPSPALRTLRGMTRGLEALKEDRVRLCNRHCRGSGAAAEAMEAVLQSMDQEIARLEKRISEHIGAEAELAQARDLLISIPGIGHTSAAQVLSELGDVSRFSSARAAAAYAGLSPSHHESGTSVKRRARLSKLGSGRLRTVLYFPALTTLRCNKAVQVFGSGLTKRGKAKMVVVGAAMRKLLHICYGVLHSGCEFDATLHPAS